MFGDLIRIAIFEIVSELLLDSVNNGGEKRCVKMLVDLCLLMMTIKMLVGFGGVLYK